MLSINFRIGNHRTYQIFLIFAIHNGKAGSKPDFHCVPAQQPVPNRMKCPTPNRSRFQWEQSLHAGKHLASGLIRESKKQDVLWLDTIVEQPGDAIGQCPSFPASGPREHQCRSRSGGDRFILLIVELGAIIDAAGANRWQAVQLVFARHLGDYCYAVRDSPFTVRRLLATEFF